MLDELLNPAPPPDIATGDRVTLTGYLTGDIDPTLYVEGIVTAATENTATIAWEGNHHEQIAFWKRDLTVVTTSPDCHEGKHHACTGDAWNHRTDTPAPCTCTHHNEGPRA